MDRTVAGSVKGLLAAVALGATAACGDTVQGPRAGDVIPLALMVAPAGPQMPSAIFGADIDSVHVQVSRYDESTAADVMIPWPANSNGLRVAVNIEMTQRVETLYVYVDLRAGQSTLFYASNQVIVEPGRVPEVPEFSLYYIGPGYDATIVSISQRNLFMPPRGTYQFSATAYNGQGQVSTSPIGWSVSDTQLASVNATTGLVTAKSSNGVFWVRAFTPSGIIDSAQVTVSSSPQVR